MSVTAQLHIVSASLYRLHNICLMHALALIKNCDHYGHLESSHADLGCTRRLCHSRPCQVLFSGINSM